MLSRELGLGWVRSLVESFKNTQKNIVATESEGVRNSICCHVDQVKIEATPAKVAGGFCGAGLAFSCY